MIAGILIVVGVVLVVDGTISGDGPVYRLCMMVMGGEVVPQEHREAEGEKQRYVAACAHKQV